MCHGFRLAHSTGRSILLTVAWISINAVCSTKRLKGEPTDLEGSPSSYFSLSKRLLRCWEIDNCYICTKLIKVLHTYAIG